MKAIVTGNSKGIGLAITEELKRLGHKVPTISRSTGYDLMNGGIEKLIEDYPETDILINNLGGGGRWGNDILNFYEWDKVMHKNYGITRYLTMHYLPKMIEKGYGRIITIASIYGTEKGAYPWFSVAKSAQIAFMRSMAHRWENVTFNSVSPGKVNLKPEDKYNINPKQVAKVVSYLCKENLDGYDITIK